MKPLPLIFQKLQKSLIDNFFYFFLFLARTPLMTEGKFLVTLSGTKKFFLRTYLPIFATSPISFVNFFIFLLTNAYKSIRMMTTKTQTVEKEK